VKQMRSFKFKFWKKEKKENKPDFDNLVVKGFGDYELDK